jgi:hypothetical protein
VKSADGLLTPTHTIPPPTGIDGIGAEFQPGVIATEPVSASRKPGWVPLPLSVYSPMRTLAAAPET